MLAGSPGLALDLGTSAKWVPSDQAVVFVDNHDTERNGSTLSYADGEEYALANVLMLAGPYGTPVVYSGYAFSDRDAGPPQDADGRVLDAACSSPDADPQDGDWVCQHRWPRDRGHGRLAQRRRRRAAASTSGRRATRWRSAGASAGSSSSTPATTSCAPSWRRACRTATTATCCRRADCAAATVRDGAVAVDVPPRTAQAWDVDSRPYDEERPRRAGGAVPAVRSGVARPDGGVRRHQDRAVRRRPTGRSTPAAPRRRRAARPARRPGWRRPARPGSRTRRRRRRGRAAHSMPARAEPGSRRSCERRRGRSRTSSPATPRWASSAYEAHSAGWGSQVTPVGEKPKPVLGRGPRQRHAAAVAAALRAAGPEERRVLAQVVVERRCGRAGRAPRPGTGTPSRAGRA